jgi:hypothetical protein
MIVIITPISIKDVFTYGFRSKIYRHPQLDVHIICGPLTKIILSVFFKINWVNYHNDNVILKTLGGRKNMAKYVTLNNPVLKMKINWYFQQMLKYSLILELKKDVIIIDGDTFPVNSSEIFTLNGVRFLNKYTPIHKYYEETIFNLLGRYMYASDKNFVCEVFPIKYERLKKMISDIEVNTKLPWNFSILLLSSDLIGFSEYQTYGRYEEQFNNINYKDFLTLRHYGSLRTPLQNIEVPENIKFITFESYDKVKGYQGILYLPFKILSLLLYKMKLK